MPDLVRVEPLRPGVAALTLDRPERRNALSIALLEALVRELEAVHAAGAARVVILRGAGPVFSAGLDLAEAHSDAEPLRQTGIGLSLRGARLAGLLEGQGHHRFEFGDARGINLLRHGAEL